MEGSALQKFRKNTKTGCPPTFANPRSMKFHSVGARAATNAGPKISGAPNVWIRPGKSHPRLTVLGVLPYEEEDACVIWGGGCMYHMRRRMHMRRQPTVLGVLPSTRGKDKTIGKKKDRTIVKTYIDFYLLLCYTPRLWSIASRSPDSLRLLLLMCSH